MHRPKSVTFISWLFVLFGVAGLYMATQMMDDPLYAQVFARNKLPVDLQVIMTFVGTLVIFISGLMMLLGLNIGRYLYVVYCLLELLVAIFASPWIDLLVGVPILLLISLYLFHSKANDYFAGITPEPPPPAPEPEPEINPPEGMGWMSGTQFRSDE